MHQKQILCYLLIALVIFLIYKYVFATEKYAAVCLKKGLLYGCNKAGYCGVAADKNWAQGVTGALTSADRAKLDACADFQKDCDTIAKYNNTTKNCYRDIKPIYDRFVKPLL